MDTRHGRRGMGEASLLCARDDPRTSRGAFVVASAESSVSLFRKHKAPDLVERTVNRGDDDAPAGAAARARAASRGVRPRRRRPRGPGHQRRGVRVQAVVRQRGVHRGRMGATLLPAGAHGTNQTVPADHQPRVLHARRGDAQRHRVLPPGVYAAGRRGARRVVAGDAAADCPDRRRVRHDVLQAAAEGVSARALRRGGLRGGGREESGDHQLETRTRGSYDGRQTGRLPMRAHDGKRRRPARSRPQSGGSRRWILF